MGKALVRAAGKDFLHLATRRNYSGTVRDPEHIPVEKTALEQEKHMLCFYSWWRDKAIIKPCMRKHFTNALSKTKMHSSHPKSLLEKSQNGVCWLSTRRYQTPDTALQASFGLCSLRKTRPRDSQKQLQRIEQLALYSNKRARGQQFSTAAQNQSQRPGKSW